MPECTLYPWALLSEVRDVSSAPAEKATASVDSCEVQVQKQQCQFSDVHVFAHLVQVTLHLAGSRRLPRQRSQLAAWKAQTDCR